MADKTTLAAHRAEHRQPLVRVVRKNDMPAYKSTLLRIGAFVVALVAGGLFILCIGQNPFDVYGTILKGSFRTSMAIQATVKIAVPLLICSLGLTFAFKMNFWNIGAEGQLIMGAICATPIALYLDGLPRPLVLILMVLAGMIGGGIWALIPAIFKVRFGTNETLFTLMLNYIALYMIMYFREGPWRDPNTPAYPQIKYFSQNARLYEVLGVHIGWIIAPVLVILVYIYLNKTKQGYEISVVGESQATARYAGMNVGRIVIRTMFISGAVCGLAGVIQISGADYTLADSVAGGVGFTAIIVAWISRLNPFVITLVSALFAILEKGCSVMQSTFQISTTASEVLQGVILFFILGFEFFTRYALVFRKRGGK